MKTQTFREGKYVIRLDHKEGSRPMFRVFDGKEEIARSYRDTIEEAARAARILARSIVEE